jgi:hypothetical protein
LPRAFGVAIAGGCALVVAACATASDDLSGNGPDSSTSGDTGTHPSDTATSDTTVTDGGSDGTTCLAPKKLCGTACVDTTSDGKNCGACGTVCGDGTTCLSSVCSGSCTKDQVLCPDGKCANLLTDPDHCGDCDTKCGLDGSGTPKICKDAVCQLDCSTKTACPGGATCVDLNTDDANCGACGHACPSGQKCALGTCVACPSTGTICGKTCVDTSSDTKNCGACGTTCSTAESCISGKCTCAAPFSDCSGSCVDEKNDPTNCGACGTVCGTGLVCADGTCSSTCAPPKSKCGTLCFDLSSDSSNCGTCGTVCGSGTFCISGKCTLGSCGRFTGGTGTTWETKKASPSLGGQPGFSDLNLAGNFYAAGGTTFELYTGTTDTWTALATIPTSVSSWVAPLWTAPDTIYMFGGSAVMQYTISSNTWTTVKSGLSTYTSAQSAHDDTGHLYTLQTDGNIAQFDIASGTVTTLTFAAGGMSEPRMTWDSCAKKLFIAPNFTTGTLYSYDPATKTTATLKSHPDGFMNDVFCGDRSGHVYAAGASGGTDMWQYTTATDTWTSLPTMPADHGDNGACAVTEDGYLYTVPVSGGTLVRLQLK